MVFKRLKYYHWQDYSIKRSMIRFESLFPFRNRNLRASFEHFQETHSTVFTGLNVAHDELVK